MVKATPILVLETELYFIVDRVVKATPILVLETELYFIVAGMAGRDLTPASLQMEPHRGASRRGVAAALMGIFAGYNLNKRQEINHDPNIYCFNPQRR